jgi:hypothetical protein
LSCWFENEFKKERKEKKTEIEEEEGSLHFHFGFVNGRRITDNIFKL